MLSCCLFRSRKSLQNNEFFTNNEIAPPFTLGGNVNSASYYAVFNNKKYELDMTRLQVWIYDKSYTCVHGTTDKYLNAHILENYIGKDLSSTKDTEWAEFIHSNYNSIETKKSMIINNNLLYVERKPLFFNEDTDRPSAILIIIIPYIDGNKLVRFDEKNYTSVKRVAKPEMYEPEPDDGWVAKVAKDQLRNSRTATTPRVGDGIGDADDIGKYRRMVSRNFELNINKIQVWVFNTKKVCIYGTQGDSARYDLEYYLGRHAEDMPDIIVPKTKFLLTKALQLVETRTTLEMQNEYFYVEALPLFYNNDIKRIYGCLILLVPFQSV